MRQSGQSCCEERRSQRGSWLRVAFILESKNNRWGWKEFSWGASRQKITPIPNSAQRTAYNIIAKQKTKPTHSRPLFSLFFTHTYHLKGFSLTETEEIIWQEQGQLVWVLVPWVVVGKLQPGTCFFKVCEWGMVFTSFKSWGEIQKEINIL